MLREKDFEGGEGIEVSEKVMEIEKCVKHIDEYEIFKKKWFFFKFFIRIFIKNH